MRELKYSGMIGFLIIIMGCNNHNIDKVIKKHHQKLNFKQGKIKQSIFSESILFDFKHSLNKCFLGDHDLLMEDKVVTKSHKTLISIERLDHKFGDQFANANFTIPDYKISDSSSNWTNKFRDNTGLYGLFICSDVENSGSCSKKISFEYNQLTRYLLHEKTDKSKVIMGKILYFKPFVISGSSIYIPTNYRNNKKEFERFITNAFKLSKPELKRTSKYIYELESKLGNYDISANEHSIIIDIAKTDVSCKFGAIKNHMRESKPTPTLQ